MVRKPSRDETPERPSNVVNLFDALKKSLSSEEKPGKKAEAPKKPARGKPRKKTSA